MTSLNAFGAILTYAIELETSLRDYYQAAGNEERSRDAEKRRIKLERVRRESVLEITLEAIDGLSEDDYLMDLADIGINAQNNVERVAARFYADVAPKINVREAQRALEKIGREHLALANG
jgi:hypothetical protein